MSDKEKDINANDETSQKDSNSQSNSDEEQSTSSSDSLEPSAIDSAFDDNADEHAKNENTSPPKSSRKKPSSSNSGSSGTKSIKWFMFILIIAAIAYAVFFGWQKWVAYQDSMQKADRVDELSQQLSDQERKLTASLSQQQQQLSSFNSQLSENQRVISQLQDQLRTTQRKIQAQSSNKQQEWLFNEAEYLIREASYKLNFTDDAASIIALLQAADEQLAALNDGSLTQVRQAISNDITAVRGSGNLDIEGIAVHLETLKSKVPVLKLASVQLQSKEPEVETVAETDLSSWQHFKHSISEAASKYYTVHHFEESAQPFISPSKDRLLRENIMLNLQTAQLAALQNNQSLFDANLSQVEQWVSQYFQQKPAETQAFLQQLSELQNSSVALELPTQLNSYRLISSISQQKVNQWLKSDANDESTEALSDDEVTEGPEA